MSINEVAEGSLKGPRAPLSGPVWNFVIGVVAACCAAFLLSLPRVVPAEIPPALRLPSHAVARARRDLDQQASGPLGQPGRRLLNLSLTLGDAEQAGRSTRTLRRSVRERAMRLREANAIDVLLRVRARMAAKLTAALQARLPLDEAHRVLGDFPVLLKRYAATRNGELRAPVFVVQALYLARWNTIHGLPATFRLAKVTRLAYHGWLALHASDAPLALRLQALQRYARLGGRHASQTAAVLHARAGRPGEALRHIREAERSQPSLRLRNHRLALEKWAGM